MRHRHHLTAGLITGGAVAAAALASGFVESASGAAALLCLTVGFALFPDLDVASVAQRWFARIVVAMLLVLMVAGAWRVAAGLGLVALLPMVHHHRGWTHSWLAVLIVPLALLWLWKGLSLGSWPAWNGLSPGAIAAPDWGMPSGGPLDWLFSYGPAYLAMASGYAAHLLLDRFGTGR